MIILGPYQRGALFTFVHSLPSFLGKCQEQVDTLKKNSDGEFYNLQGDTVVVLWLGGTSLYPHRENKNVLHFLFIIAHEFLEHVSNQPQHPDNVTHQGIAIGQPHMGNCA